MTPDAQQTDQSDDWHEILDAFVCPFPIKEGETFCKSNGKCIVDHLDTKARRGHIGGELCWSMQEMKRIKDYCQSILRARPHTPAPETSGCNAFDEGWNKGFLDGGSAVQHDLNLIEDKAARAATLAAIKEDADILKYWGYKAGAIVLLDAKHRADTLAALRQRAGEQ